MHTHACAVPGCTHQIRVDMLMCLAHWRLVPKPIRDEINTQWHSGHIDLSYFRARAAAIEAVRRVHDAAT